MIVIDIAIFLDTYERFEVTLLPILNNQLQSIGKPPMTENEAIDKFLDLRQSFIIKEQAHGLN